MPNQEQPRPLYGAVVTNDQIRGVVFEDGGSAKTVDAAAPHILSAADRMLESGGVTPEAAMTMQRAKNILNHDLQPIIGRYDMCCVLGQAGSAPDSLVEDLTATAFRASAISILEAASRLLDPTEHDSLLDRLDRIEHELSRRSTDARQFAYLKRPEVTSVINEAVGECAGILRKSVDEYQQLETQFAEPELFARIFIVFHHSGERLGLF